MRSKLFFFVSLAISAMAISCGKQETDLSSDETQAVKPESGKIILSAIAADTKAAVASDGAVTWSETDKIAVWSTGGGFSEFSLSDGAGETTAHFTGNIPEGGKPSAVAVYPSSIATSLSGTTLGVTLPAEIAWSEVCQPPMVAVFSDNGEEPLAFRHLGGVMYLEVSNVPVGATSLRLTAANKQLSGSFSVDISDSTPEIKADGAEPSSLTITFDEIPEATSETGATKAFWLPVPTGTYDNFSVAFYGKDGSQIPGMKVTAKKNANKIERAGLLKMPKVDLGLRLVWAYGSLSGEDALSQFSGTTPAIDAGGNVYVTTNGSKLLTKISPKGAKLWSKEIGSGTTQNTSPSIDTDDMVVYAALGNGTSTALRAFDSDGNEKWTFPSTSFYGGSNTPSPNLNQIAPAVGSNNVYIGNGGTVGTVLSIKKTTGERVAYVGNSSGGGPAGGVQSGMAISKAGIVSWFCNYGMFGVHQNKLDNPTETSSFGAYAPWEGRYGYTWAWKNSNSAVACSTIDGENVIWCVGVEGTSSGTFNLHVICASADTFTGTAPGSSQNWKFDHKISGVKQQDQGGIVIGPQGEAIIALKNLNNGGGIYAVNTRGQKAYRYSINADVCGAPAVDSAGNIHFVDDNGWYYILKPDYTAQTCTLLCKCNLYALAQSKGKDLGTATKARAWTSTMIGQDGKLYRDCRLMFSI